MVQKALKSPPPPSQIAHQVETIEIRPQKHSGNNFLCVYVEWTKTRDVPQNFQFHFHFQVTAAFVLPDVTMKKLCYIGMWVGNLPSF